MLLYVVMIMKNQKSIYDIFLFIVYNYIMKKVIFFTVIFLGIISWVVYILFWNSPFHWKYQYQTDFARIEKAIIAKEIHVRNTQEIQKTIKETSWKVKKISIAGKRYSGWGHTFTEDALVIDMWGFNKILDYDPSSKKITVQSGITWWEIQKYINKDSLSIKVMQSSNIFSVWWSISSNVHGRDPRYGTIADTVDSFRLINAQWELLDVSYENNPELFWSVIGGFWLFWVITDVTLSLQDNESLIAKTYGLNGENYTSYLKENIIDNQEIW
jgi:decaprenylphospho-beta-D-ribofuranose 2-oxidase